MCAYAHSFMCLFYPSTGIAISRSNYRFPVSKIFNLSIPLFSLRFFSFNSLLPLYTTTEKKRNSNSTLYFFFYPDTFTHSTLHLQDFMVKSVLVKYFLFSLYYPTNAVTPVLFSYFLLFLLCVGS